MWLLQSYLKLINILGFFLQKIKPLHLLQREMLCVAPGLE